MGGDQLHPRPPKRGGGSEEHHDGGDKAGLKGLLDAWEHRYACADLESPAMHDHGKAGSSARTRTLLLDPSDLDISTETVLEILDLGEELETDIPRGTVIGGKWRVLEKKGEGTFGSFYLGEHRILGMQVGIKVLKRWLTARPASRDAFWQEAMRLSRLVHPNIVHVHDYGEEDGRPFIVMEYLDGIPLRKALEKASLSVTEAVEVIYQTSLALIAAHGGAGNLEPVVHLDLKPEHIFLQRNQDRLHVKVIDFGIAEIAGPGLREDASDDKGEPGGKGRIVGTPEYMAPERWKGVIDPRCDIYALGIIFYEVMAGRRPFLPSRRKGTRGVETHSTELRYLHESFMPSAPSFHRAGRQSPAVRALDPIILNCLKKHPADRPASAAALAQELKDWQGRSWLSPGQKLLKSVGVPALLTIALLGLVFLGQFLWGPQYEVMLDSTEPLVIGPASGSRRIAGRVTRGRYEGGEVFLELELKGETVRVCLGTLVGSEFATDESLRLDAVENVLGRRVPDGKEWGCRGTVVVDRFPWRTLRSDGEGIPVKLDRKGPEIRIQGRKMAPSVEEKTVWLDSHSCTVDADEPLDPESCYIAHAAEEIRADVDSTAATFEFTAGESLLEAELHVRDIVGNRAPLHKLSFHWYDKPNLVEPPPRGKVFTSNPTYKGSLVIRGECVRAEVDGAPVTLEKVRGQAAEQGCTADYEITFPDSDGPQEREVTVGMWSSRYRDRSQPDAKETFTIGFFRRELDIRFQQDLTTLGALPEKLEFVVTDGHGGEIRPSCLPDDGLDCKLDWIPPGSQGSGPLQSIETRIEYAAQGRIEILDDLEGRPGRLSLRVEVEDIYGNRTAESCLVTHNLEAPAVKVEQPAAQAWGAEKRGLLLGGCLLRGEPDNEDLLEDMDQAGVGVRISYLYDWTSIVLVNGRALSLDIEEDVLRYRDLLPHLHSRENRVEVVAFDRNLDEISGSSSTTVYCAEPLRRVRIDPPSDRVQPGDVTVRVDVDGGPPVREITVDDRTAKREGDVWSRTVRIGPVKKTAVGVSVGFEGGWKWAGSIQYIPEPVHGTQYTFEFADKEAGSLSLVYHEEDDGAGSLWFVPVQQSVDLWMQRAGSSAGQYDSPSFAEALTVARRLTESLGLEDEEGARLPTYQELRRILRRQPGEVESGAEWLGEVPEEMGASIRYAFAERKANGGLECLGANGDGGDRFPFRIVMPVTDRLMPEHARSAKALLEPESTRGD